MIRFENNIESQTVTIYIAGRMDTLKSATLMESISANLPQGEQLASTNIVMDLGEVDYISSSFIRVCVSVGKMAAPGRFSIVNSQPFVKKTFIVSGLDEALRVS